MTDCATVAGHHSARLAMCYAKLFYRRREVYRQCGEPQRAVFSASDTKNMKNVIVTNLTNEEICDLLHLIP